MIAKDYGLHIAAAFGQSAAGSHLKKFQLGRNATMRDALAGCLFVLRVINKIENDGRVNQEIQFERLAVVVY